MHDFLEQRTAKIFFHPLESAFYNDKMILLELLIQYLFQKRMPSRDDSFLKQDWKINLEKCMIHLDKNSTFQVRGECFFILYLAAEGGSSLEQYYKGSLKIYIIQ